MEGLSGSGSKKKGVVIWEVKQSILDQYSELVRLYELQQKHFDKIGNQLTKKVHNLELQLKDLYSRAHSKVGTEKMVKNLEAQLKDLYARQQSPVPKDAKQAVKAMRSMERQLVDLYKELQVRGSVAEVEASVMKREVRSLERENKMLLKSVASLEKQLQHFYAENDGKSTRSRSRKK